MKLERFDPPANLADFDGIPGQLEQWSNAVSGWFDEAIASEIELFAAHGLPHQKCQFFNPTETDPGGAEIDQEIVWNGFPRTLQLAFGQAKAHLAADQLFSLSGPRPGLPTAAPFCQGEVWSTGEAASAATRLRMNG